MRSFLSPINRERSIAFLLAMLGGGSLAWSWMASPPSHASVLEFLLALAFGGAIILADNYPVHILRGTKVSLINLPIFLSAVLLPAPLAICATGAGLFVAHMRMRAERGLFPRDIIGIMGQWMFIAFVGNSMAHLPLRAMHSDMLKDGLLFVSAVVFLLIDFLLFAFSQSVILSEPFVPILKSIVKEGLPLEMTQYFIAILGALAAYENLWSLFLLIVPVVITYVAFKNLKETRFETIQILEDMADMVDLRDVYTGGHSKRVADLVRGILIQMEISGPEATIVEIAARLHDIGKIGIADSILKKPARLLPEEMTVMRTHPEKGAELISKYKDFSRGAEMILYHHERWDGTGYPAGIKANDIPFGARVIAVADGFDAMTSDRTYRKALSTGQAIQILLDGRDTQWDSKVVMALLGLLSRQAAKNSLENGNKVEVGVSQSISGSTILPK